MNFCQCGCREKIEQFDKRGRPCRFKRGHGNKNKRPSDETREKIRQAKLGMVPWNKDKHHTEETIEKMRQTKLGKKASEETKEKMRQNNSKYWLGRKRSDEVKENMRLSHLGKYPSEETKNKLSLNNVRYWLGKRRSEDTVIKMSNAFKDRYIGEGNPFYGKHHSKETKEKFIGRKTSTKSENTSIEVKLQNLLSDNNIVFEKHIKIFGRPDIFIEPNICIFADGDYWHMLPKALERDPIVNETLKQSGYKVLRFWEHEINNDIQRVIWLILTRITIESIYNNVI